MPQRWNINLVILIAQHKILVALEHQAGGFKDLTGRINYNSPTHIHEMVHKALIAGDPTITHISIK